MQLMVLVVIEKVMGILAMNLNTLNFDGATTKEIKIFIMFMELYQFLMKAFI